MKKALSILLSLCMLFSITAGLDLTTYAETESYYTYTVSYGKAEITDCNEGISGDIEIPSTLGGYPVTSIGDGTFESCISLTSVTIPDSLTSIGKGAFAGCTSLTSLTIPDSVASIGDKAFSYCTSLANITVVSSNENYSSQDGVLFNKDKTELIQYPVGNTRASYSIPNSVTSIGDNTFAYCTSLTSVTIPNSVTHLGDFAFASCTSLTSLTISDNVTSIGELAFVGCICLIGITVDSSNEYYSSQDGVLFNKDKTALIQYPARNTRTSYSIPNSVTSIGKGAFLGCSSLTSVTIPDSVTSIGNSTFAYCTSLTSVTIPNSVKHLGGWAFKDCTSLTDVYYNGTIEEWNKISFESGNDDLLNANIHFNFSPAENMNAKGGSIRLSDKGLRFGFSYSEDENTTVEEYGFVYASGSVSDLTIDTIGARTSVANNRITHADGTTTFNLVFTNIPPAAYNMVISARAYVKIDGEYYYSDILQRSFMGVANAVLADDSVDDSIKQELTEIIKEA